MSYCVNCGVELDETEKECPLCLVEVLNPISPYNPRAERHYPDLPIYGFKQNGQDLVPPLALLMSVPISLSIVLDLLTSGRISWSFYVAASLLLLTVFVLPPLAMNMNQPKAMLCIFLDYVGILAYLYAVDYWIAGNWFWNVAMPLSAVGGALAIGQVYFFMRFRVRKLVMFSIASASLGLTTLMLDILVKRHKANGRVVGWSLFVLVPCIIGSALALVINNNAHLKEQVKQRFFI